MSEDVYCTVSCCSPAPSISRGNGGFIETKKLTSGSYLALVERWLPTWYHFSETSFIVRTLLTCETGAQVLAHSLRDGGSTKRLAVLVTLAGVNEQTVVELKVFTSICGVVAQS